MNASDREKECYANLRVAYHEILETLRNQALVMNGILAILVPTTSIGFLIKPQDNEWFIVFIGFGNIIIWLSYWLIVRFPVSCKIKIIRNYGKSIEDKLKQITKDTNIDVIDVISSAKPHLGNLLHGVGFLICVLWVIRIIMIADKLCA